jgi:hypothetical protein
MNAKAEDMNIKHKSLHQATLESQQAQLAHTHSTLERT